MLHPMLHYEPSVVALLGAGLLILITDVTTEEALADVEWPTLVFFAGLFVMVGGLVETGVIGDLSKAHRRRDRRQARPRGDVAARRLGGALGDRRQHPLRRDDGPVVAGLVAGHRRRRPGLWWSLAFGADLGGNATAIGASANVVMLGLAERAGHRIGFWEFTKYGLVVTVVTVGLTVPYIALRYL